MHRLFGLELSTLGRIFAVLYCLAKRGRREVKKKMGGGENGEEKMLRAQIRKGLRARGR